jgi:hypothetical protein
MLHLRPPATARYAAALSWEAYASGDYQLATVEKEVTLTVQPGGAGLAVEFATSPPSFTKNRDPEPLEELALRLAALYRRVRVQAAPTGKLLALLNHEELLEAGRQQLEELRAATLASDEVTPTLLDFAERQLQRPSRIMGSLQHDYLYQTLLPDFYNQSLSGSAAPSRTKQFANFFDKTPLWFSEQATVQPGQLPDQLLVRLQGSLDRQKTDVAAVQAHVVAALQLASPAGAPPSDLPALHFHYEATYTLAVATGLPQQAALTVYVRAGQLFNKEYHLTLTQV